MSKSWLKWPLAEGETKAVEAVFQKLVGLSVSTFSGAILANTLSGVVNMAGGLAGGVLRKKSFLPGRRQIFLGLLFGLTALAMVAIKIWAFNDKNADLAVVTFIAAASIVPGALADHLFFNHRMTPRKWFGVLIFMASGYAILGRPSLEQLSRMPLWVWLSATHAVLEAANECISQIQARARIVVDPMINNFWIGLSRSAFGIAGFAVLARLGITETVTLKFVIFCVIMGFFSTSVNVFKLMAYKDGGDIASKKLVMQVVVIISAMIYGALFFGEPLSWEKIVGIAGYLVSFVLLDN